MARSGCNSAAATMLVQFQGSGRGEQGWVSRLHHLLEVRVSQLLGWSPRIRHDPKLQGNDYFADAILERSANP